MTRIGKCAVTGSQGQLGAELCRQVAPVVGLDLPEFDITDRDRVVSTIMQVRPEVVINTAAFTRVDEAEQQPALCRRVNVDGVGHLVEACRQLDCTLVQISTDYVFGRAAGRTTPYRETDDPGPLSVYGQTKLEAERLVAQWPKHFIVRTCGLYGRLGPRSAGNFAETMLRLAATRAPSGTTRGGAWSRLGPDRRSAPGRPLRVVNDQRCTPSYVPHVARAIRFLAATTAYGTYHIVNSGETTWYEFAKELFRQAGLNAAVDPITTAEYGALAPRPAYSVLDTGKYRSLSGCPAMPSWRDALAEYLAQKGEITGIRGDWR
jgi:dTDP-4-dehydrorhamnose reductase